MKTPILGGSYTARTVNAAVSRMVNLFPEAIPEGGKGPAFLSRCPGLVKKATVGIGPIRGLHEFGGYAYAVSGQGLYKISPSYSATLIGTISGSGSVSMSDNGTQLFIACNPSGCIYNASTGILASISDVDFPGAVTVGYIDGYFVFNEPDSQKVWVTSLLDGTAIDPLEYASAEGSPDRVVAISVTHREVWIFGSSSVEVWYNSGSLDYPLTRISGAFIETGCVAAYSIAQLDNTLFWLGSDNRGSGIVFKASGYGAVRVSNHAIESAILEYESVDDAIAYSYQQGGHSFYVLTFPTDGKTWCYDVATNEWHERAGFLDGQFTRHRSNCHVHFNRENIVGDYNSGDLYAFDLNTFADDIYEQKWLRSWRALPTGGSNLDSVIHGHLQIDFEAGVGLSTGQGDNPQVMLRWSDDGGHTWSNEHWRSIGKIGEYSAKAIWRRLGRSYDRVYEISGTDPVGINIMGAEITAGGAWV